MCIVISPTVSVPMFFTFFDAIGRRERERDTRGMSNLYSDHGSWTPDKLRFITLTPLLAWDTYLTTWSWSHSWLDKTIYPYLHCHPYTHQQDFDYGQGAFVKVTNLIAVQDWPWVTCNYWCDCNDTDTEYSELESILNRESSYSIAIHCFVTQKSGFISKLIEHTVINISPLGCL
jgi:hypothetical protein